MTWSSGGAVKEIVVSNISLDLEDLLELLTKFYIFLIKTPKMFLHNKEFKKKTPPAELECNEKQK